MDYFFVVVTFSRSDLRRSSVTTMQIFASAWSRTKYLFIYSVTSELWRNWFLVRDRRARRFSNDLGSDDTLQYLGKQLHYPFFVLSECFNINKILIFHELWNNSWKCIMLIIGQIGHDLVFSPNNIYNINICNFQIIFYFNYSRYHSKSVFLWH